MEPSSKQADALSPKQIAFLLVVGIGAVAGIAAANLNSDSDSSSATSEQTQPAQPAQQAAAEPSFPAECEGKHLQSLFFYSRPDENAIAFEGITNNQGAALSMLVNNGNYEILSAEMVRFSGGERVCMAKVHIDGEVRGNSYSGTWYMKAD